MSNSNQNSGDLQESGGVIVLSGAFALKHKFLLLELVRTTECVSFLSSEMLQIVRITEEEDRVVVETAVVELAARIGDRLCAVCGGFLSEGGSENGDKRVWFRWTRDNTPTES